MVYYISIWVKKIRNSISDRNLGIQVFRTIPWCISYILCTFIGCGNLSISRVMSAFYTHKFPYLIKTQDIKKIDDYTLLNIRNILILVWNWVFLLFCFKFRLKSNRLLYELRALVNEILPIGLGEKYKVMKLYYYS